MTRENRLKYFLFAGSFTLFILWTWQLPFLGPDEPRYAQVAREMLEHKDFFVPRLGGNAWFEKPVLLYWLMALSYASFGVNEFAARLPSVLAAFFSVVILYGTMNTIRGAKEALLSATVLATTSFFASFSHAATFDMLLTFCITSALCCYLLYEHEQRNSKWLRWMYVFAGSGVLAKGFVALALIGIILISYLILSRRWKELFLLKPVEGALIVAAVTAIWFIPVSMIYGSRFWDEFVYRHHFVRYTSTQYHRSQSLLFYIPVMLAGTYPWSFAPFSARPAATDLKRFALCWLLGPVVFFTISQTKLPGYVLPVIPAFAILAGLSLAVHTNRIRALALGIGVNLLLIGGLLWGAQEYEIPTHNLYIACGYIAVFLLFVSFLYLKRKFFASTIAYALILPAAMALFAFRIFPDLNWIDSKKLPLQWAETAPQNAKLVPYNLYDFGPLFYTNGRMELTPEGYPFIVTSDAQLHRYLMQRGEAHVLALNEDVDWMKRAGFWKVHNIIRGENISIVELHPQR